MNKHYLFRGKRIDNGEWVYGDRHTTGAYNFIFDDDLGEWIEVNPTTVGQSTGLLAAKSYRGDSEDARLAFESDVCWDSDWEVAFVVFWSKDHLSWMVRFMDDSGEEFLQEFLPGDSVEIIVTIHDPELLEKGEAE